MSLLEENLEKHSQVTNISEPVFELYRLQNKYYLVDGQKLRPDLTAQTVKSHIKKHEHNTGNGLDFDIDVIDIEKVRYYPDIFQKSDIQHNQNLEELTVRVNITESWNIHTPTANEEEIITHYTQSIWNNKLHDLVKIIIYALYKKEERFNKLLLTAPSSKGKSELFRIMDFVDIDSKTFVSMLEQKQGQGQLLVNEVRKSGLLLWDDVEQDIPKTIHNIQTTMPVRVLQEGMQRLPSNFVAITSTHSGCIDMAEDQTVKRMLHMDVGNHDHILNDTGIDTRDPEHYRAVTSNYIKYLINETIKEVKVSSSVNNDFMVLRNKYKISSDGRRFDMFQMVIDDIKDEIQMAVTSQINKTYQTQPQYVGKDGDYYFKSITAFKNKISNKIREVVRSKSYDIPAMEAELFRLLAPNPTQKKINVTQNWRGYKISLDCLG